MTAERPGADDAAMQRKIEDLEDLRYKECTFQPKILPLRGKYDLQQ